jgi:hypothetical protein
MKRLVNGETLLIVVDPSRCCHINMYLHFFIHECSKVKRKLGVHLKTQYRRVKEKYQDILASRLTSEEKSGQWLKKGLSQLNRSIWNLCNHSISLFSVQSLFSIATPTDITD